MGSIKTTRADIMARYKRALRTGDPDRMADFEERLIAFNKIAPIRYKILRKSLFNSRKNEAKRLHNTYRGMDFHRRDRELLQQHLRNTGDKHTIL